VIHSLSGSSLYVKIPEYFIHRWYRLTADVLVPSFNDDCSLCDELKARHWIDTWSALSCSNKRKKCIQRSEFSNWYFTCNKI